MVASPDATHPALVRACVEAGKPVLCEKPLSPTLADSAALLDDLGERASLVSLGFMRRFDPGYTDLARRWRRAPSARPSSSTAPGAASPRPRARRRSPR